MRPDLPGDDDAVALLRAEVPEFEDQYRDLLEIYDDDLSAAIVFMELADYVTALLARLDSEATLEKVLDIVERIAGGSAEGGQLIADAFLAELHPLTTERLRPLLGTAGASLLDRLEEGPGSGDLSL